MAIRTVVTRGFGNGTFDGTIALVTLRGYSVSSVLIVSVVALILPIRSIDFILQSRDIDLAVPGRDINFALLERDINLTVSDERSIDFTPLGPE